MKKLISLIIVLCTVFSIGVTAFAYESTVDLNAAAPNFSITVPLSLPVTMDAAGNITVSNDKAIVNNSAMAVKVASVSVSGQNGWSQRAGSEFTAANQYDIKINNSVPDSAAASFGTIAANGGTAAVNYSVLVPRQSSAVNQTIARVEYTFAFVDDFGGGGTSDTPVQDAITLLSGKYFAVDNESWQALAQCGAYTLLFSPEVTDEHFVPSALSASVAGVDVSGETSRPAAGAGAMFDLSKTEYESFFASSELLVPVSDGYMLRTSGYAVCGNSVIQNDDGITAHRTAVWVLTSAINIE